jgi:hypothetical protein
VSSEWTWIWYAIAAAGGALLLLVVWIWRKGRAFGAGDVFRASRLSGGNRIFPTQVRITPSSVVHYTPQWFGREEQTIHMAHVSSVTIDTGLLFSDVRIETSGGSEPIRCHGHRKQDAVRMQELIERYQTDYYRRSTQVPPALPAPLTAPGNQKLTS